MSGISIDLTGGASSDAVLSATSAADLAPLDAPMDLPERAELQPDGSVMLTLAYPATVAFRGAPGTEAKTETYAQLLLMRLLGADARKMLDAPDARSNA
ncbi:MAG: hypothetical protein ACRDNS_24640, partial [Trebonia sp.]